ncbi:ATP-binding protein [Algoriphagus sp. C2-6-M1]|uniref:AAA family ATPase n=1 Tax=Algoriphagus persicinus TaxID=3108754 RepID=UPI002B3787AD|nr:ATP-binding protein [Algoriphagus sp. C2-6-M1]MEB2780411.1 ATP-binding protein [Algoriphagus sp. C2-6-M1]
MKLKTPNNPFPTSGYYGPQYFCDREEESKHITKLLQNGNSCLLIGNRRLGKTALIFHIRHLIPKTTAFVYLDILATENEQQFLDVLGSALLQAFPEKSTLGKKVWEFVKTLRPLISFDPLSGIPNVSFQLEKVENPVTDIFLFLENLNQPIIVAIDEFQQIRFYPEQNTDAWLRATMQQLQNVQFLFSGSRQSLLSELFSDPKRPFFKSVSPFKLEKINQNDYRDFIIKIFASHGKQLSEELAEELLEWTKCHTYYVQHLCNRIFQVPEKKLSRADWQGCAQNILKEQEVFFFHYRSLLSPQQWKLLVAIAKAGIVYSPTSKDFIAKNNLGSSATVFKSIDSLLDKEMIYKEYNQEGNPFYQVYDVFFERWIQGGS